MRTAAERFRVPILVIGAANSPRERGRTRIYRAAVSFRPSPRAAARALFVEPERPIVAIGAYRYRPGAFELTDAADRRLPLTEKEAEILTRLAAARGAVVTKDMLLRDVWGYHPTVTTRTLETHVSRLRRKIETDPAEARLLLTEKNGYRLNFSPAR